jgi:hypothetical protein
VAHTTVTKNIEIAFYRWCLHTGSTVPVYEADSTGSTPKKWQLLDLQ